MRYEYWLASVRPLSDKKKRRLRQLCGTAEEVYREREERLARLDFLTPEDAAVIANAGKETDPEQSYAELAEKGIRFIPYFHREYPERLRDISAPPYALYVRGRLPGAEQKTAAIVGARGCTPYGEAMALEYGEELARAGVQVISGMARGIDGAGQRGALNGGGETYAVLGCGADICYPRENIGLYGDILKKGGILSEQPPGEPPLPAYFPLRNRIISGLSDAVLVMEAREKSGSLITADQALEQGKDVYALPGPVTSPLSQGCHRLIAQGAGILVTPGELLKELRIQIVRTAQKQDKNKKVLESPENLVYSCLDLFPKDVGELVRTTGFAPGEVLRILTSLEIEGCIKEVSKNYYVRTR